jgi:hypothetical protein
VVAYRKTKYSISKKEQDDCKYKQTNKKNKKTKKKTKPVGNICVRKEPIARIARNIVDRRSGKRGVRGLIFFLYATRPSVAYCFQH